LFKDLERLDLAEESDFSALFSPLDLLEGDLAVEDVRDLPLATCDWLLVLTPLGIEMIYFRITSKKKGKRQETAQVR